MRRRAPATPPGGWATNTSSRRWRGRTSRRCRPTGEYDAPRRVLGAIPGAKIVEMAQCRERSFCCGAGGGLYWLEDRVGQRVSHVRTSHVAATGAQVVATACPFCMLLLG